MHIKLFIEPKDEKKFREDLREFLNNHAKNCQETLMIDSKLVVQEKDEFSKAWFYLIEKEKEKPK